MENNNLNKEQYIEQWNIVDEKYKENIKPYDLEKDGYEDQLVPEEVVWAKWIGRITILLAVVIGIYGYTIQSPIMWGAAPAAIIGAVAYFFHYNTNKEGFSVNKGLNKKIAKLDKIMNKFYKTASTAKLKLSNAYAKTVLGEHTNGKLVSHFTEKKITLVDVYTKVRTKDSSYWAYSRTAIYSIGGVKLPLYDGINTQLRNRRSFQGYTIDKIVEENKVIAITAVPLLPKSKFDIRIIAKNLPASSLVVKKPYDARKERNWDENEMAPLLGEYYPRVTAGTQQELFKFFTPRRTIFFKENKKAKLIKRIEGNNFICNSSNLDIKYLKIDPKTWGDTAPADFFKILETFATSKGMSGYSVTNHDFYRGDFQKMIK